jgi:hypothetical protein
MKKTFTFLALIVLTMLHTANAQIPESNQSPEAGNTSFDRFELGVRLGIAVSITGRVFSNPNTAIEGIISFPVFDTRFGLTGLYEKFGRFSNGLAFFYGVGAHAGDYTVEFVRNEKTYGGIIFGVDGILGLDYTFPTSPFNISLDWKPAIDIIPFFGNRDPLFEFGLSFRYIF